MKKIKINDFEIGLKEFSDNVSQISIAKIGDSKKHYKNYALSALNLDQASSDPGEHLKWSIEGLNSEFIIKKQGREVANFSELKYQLKEKQGEKKWLSVAQNVSRESMVYGLGEKTRYLEKSGATYEMWNRNTKGFYTHNEDPLYASFPFYIIKNSGASRSSFNFIGVFIAQAERSRFRVKNNLKENKVGIDLSAPEMTIYLMPSDNIKQIIKRYTDLTGKPFFPPKWAIGYHHSKYGAPQNQTESIKLANKFREEQIPCDALYFDLQHMDENKVFTWAKQGFPKPKKLISELHEKNFKSVLIVDPGVKKEKGYEVYDSGKKRDIFIKDEENDDFTGSLWPGFCTYPDLLNSGAREWWAEENEALLKQGIDGIWNDMNEPTVFFGKKQLYNIASTLKDRITKGEHLNSEVRNQLRDIIEVASDSMVHKADNGEEVEHRKVHNLYALYQAIATKEAFARNNEGSRPFILTRSGFSGIQKYAALWTGDNSSTWEHMKLSIYMSLNLGLSGVPFVGADIGGYKGDVEPELLTRWIQLGAVSPFFRNHSSLHTTSQEPWSFNDEYKEINRKYISLRYKLLPFFYTEFFNSHKTGLPVMRPLFMEFPDDEESYTVSNQFMVGESLLVAPVLERKSDIKFLYLPHENGEEITWLNWWTGERFESGYHTVEAPLEIMPIFLREGKGIPFTDVVQHTEEQPDKIKLWSNTGKSGSKTVKIPIYHDDGETKGFQRGEYFYGNFIINHENGEKKVKLKVENNGYKKFWNDIEVI